MTGHGHESDRQRLLLFTLRPLMISLLLMAARLIERAVAPEHDCPKSNDDSCRNPDSFLRAKHSYSSQSTMSAVTNEPKASASLPCCRKFRATSSAHSDKLITGLQNKIRLKLSGKGRWPCPSSRPERSMSQ